jgi:hypothetical protein
MTGGDILSSSRITTPKPANNQATQLSRWLRVLSIGQWHTWETLLQKKVSVDLKESVLRGGKRCVFEIHVSEQAI